MKCNPPPLASKNTILSNSSHPVRSASSDTVRFKEKRTMKYPWMKVMFKEVVSKDQKLDIENVESLESFKPPNTKSMRFY